MLGFLEADTFRVCLIDSFRTGKVDKDEPAFQVLDLIRNVLPESRLVDVDMQDGMRSARSIVHALTRHLAVDQPRINDIHRLF